MIGVAVPRQHELHVHLAGLLERRQVLNEGLRTICRAVRRTGEERVGGDVPQQMVRGDQDLPLAIVEDRVRRAVPRAVVDRERAIPKSQLLAVVQHPGHLRAGSPGAEGPRHRPERSDHVLGNAVPEHHLGGEVVVRLRLHREVLHEADRHVQGGHLGARARCHQGHEPKVVDVLVGEDHEFDVLERVPQSRYSSLQLVERSPRIWPRIHKGERLVLDEVDVDAADRERRRNGDAMDSFRRRGRERVAGLCVRCARNRRDPSGAKFWARESTTPHGALTG